MASVHEVVTLMDAPFPASMVAESLMSVLCVGGRWILDHLDEKHDFETRVTDAGFRHEEFTLHVKPVGASGAVPSPGGYEVKVTHAPTRTVKAYRGGPGQDWVARFGQDLSAGLFGHPELPVEQGMQREPTSPSRRRRSAAP